MELIGLLDPAVLAKFLPYVLLINLVLSSVSKGLAILGKNVPAVEKIAIAAQKIVDFFSANPKH